MTTSWKQKLTSLESLTKNNGKAAWETAKLVRDLWKDRKFLEEACGNKPDEADAKLSKFSGRFALGLNDMLQMIEHFPNLKDWESGRLDILRDETCKLLAKRSIKQGVSSDEDGQRQRITVAQFRKMEQENKQLKAENRRLRAEIDRLIERIPKMAEAA